MPLYDYKCPKCGRTFEGYAKMTEPPPVCGNLLTEEKKPPQHGLEITRCDGQTVKVFAGARPAPQFKGDGWAKDGYSSKK